MYFIINLLKINYFFKKKIIKIKKINKICFEKVADTQKGNDKCQNDLVKEKTFEIKLKSENGCIVSNSLNVSNMFNKYFISVSDETRNNNRVLLLCTGSVCDGLSSTIYVY